MQRALRTAQIAGFSDPQVTPLLQEVDYGDYEGQTTKQIQEQRPGWQLYRDGCPDGETPAQVYARAKSFLDLATATEGTVLAFGHGHMLRAIGVAWLDLDIMVAEQFLLDVATLNKLQEDARGREIALWNSP